MILVDDVFKYLLFVTFKLWLAIFLHKLIRISSIWTSPRPGVQTAEYSDFGFGFIKQTNECVFEPNIKRSNR